MSWITDHGQSYNVPEEIYNNRVDLSWGNNTCPCFSVWEHDIETNIVLWVEHEHEDQREGSDRFVVQYINNRDGIHHDLLNTDSLKETLKFIDQQFDMNAIKAQAIEEGC